MNEYWDEDAQRRYLRDRTRVMDWLYIHMPDVHRVARDVPIPFETTAIEDDGCPRTIAEWSPIDDEGNDR